MAQGSRRAYVFTVCLRDDDDKTFEFRSMSDSSQLVARVTAGIAGGRHVRCYVLAADPDAQDREERYLTGKGYKRSSVAL